MVIKCPYFYKVIVHWFISDDDRSMHVVLCQHHFGASINTKDKDLLPTRFIKPKFKANPRHQNKVVIKCFYKLKELTIKIKDEL